MSTAARNGNLMRQRREALGMKLIDLAEALERSPAFVSTCEGGFVPKPESQIQIAAALDTTPDELWPQEWEEWEKA